MICKQIFKKEVLKALQLNGSLNLFIIAPNVSTKTTQTFQPTKLISTNANLFSTSKQQQQKPKIHTFDQNSSYFEVLNISPSATEQQIKTAYLQMVKKYHPDLSKQQNASQKFQLIQKAYEILSDPQTRGKHRSELNIPNPQRYQAADQIKEKFKNFKRKDSVPDEWQFSYKLFKRHYEQVDAKQKDYKRFVGQGDDYYVHKDQLQPQKKVYAQQFAMIAGSIGIATAAFYYVYN